MKTHYIILIFLSFTLACQQRQSIKEKRSVADAEVESAALNAPTKAEEQTSQIIKTANYRFQVENIDSATKKVKQITSKRQGTIANMNLTSSVYEISNQLTIRVPAKNFEALLDEFGAQSIYMDYKRISTEDVTEEFIDIETRLKTKKEVRDRYIDILKTKAKTVEDVLKAEEQIRIIQEEIEAKEGRLKYLTNKVAESTINLEVYQKLEYREKPSEFEEPYMAKIKQGFSNGWSFVKGALIVLINLWPIVLVGSFLYWRRNWIRKFFGRKE
jgi:hypothetical protein